MDAKKFNILLTGLEITGIMILSVIALKRNGDAHKAECEAEDLLLDLSKEKLNNIVKDIKIQELENKLSKCVSNEES